MCIQYRYTCWINENMQRMNKAYRIDIQSSYWKEQKNKTHMLLIWNWVAQSIWLKDMLYGKWKTRILAFNEKLPSDHFVITNLFSFHFSKFICNIFSWKINKNGKFHILHAGFIPKTTKKNAISMILPFTSMSIIILIARFHHNNKKFFIQLSGYHIT